MNASVSRTGWLACGFSAAIVALLVYLWFLMVHGQATWAQRSHQNRWSFRAVPSQRGELRDRFGRLLAYDTPTTQLAMHYPRFRQLHPVGAAVHGATRWSARVPGRPGVRYDYGEGSLGPEAAARALLAMPARWLSPRALTKDLRAELQTAVTTVLAALSGGSRRETFAAVRKAAAVGDERAVGDVLSIGRAELLRRFDAEVAELRRLDAELRELRRQRLESLQLADEEIPGLLGTLDRLRAAGASPDPEAVPDPLRAAREAVRTTFAEQVPFELAAGLVIAAKRHPGIEVEPSVAREAVADAGTALRALLGTVAQLDRAEPGAGWLLRRLGDALPANWLEEFVPAALLDDEQMREHWQGDAAERYLRELRRVERRGISGIEAAFDSALMGRLGMRFVERDHKRREHRLFGHLQVQAGDAVTVTLDLDLQRLAEVATERAARRWQGAFEDPDAQRMVEAALAVIDANTGDVLAYGGAPIVSPKAIHVPGVVWFANGAIGSVVKPIVLVEQLAAAAEGRPHRPLATLDGCGGVFPFADLKLRCGAAHWDGGRDPVDAIAQSCNLFFYQCGMGLGEAGLQQALQRFGLWAPPRGDEPAPAAWQPTVQGLAVAAPKWQHRALLPQRAIGYGIEASPLHIARAYAVFATGSLPTLGMVAGEARPALPLPDVAPFLDVARAGLLACVQRGTAKALPDLHRLGVAGKTGTAEVTNDHRNNAWFAGYLPAPGGSGVHLCLCAVVYYVPDAVHGGDAAGELVAGFLTQIEADPALRARYLPEGGR